MRDVLSASIVAAIGLLGLAPFQLHAQGQDGQQITKQILATWGEANKTVQTLKCEASLDSFFPQRGRAATKMRSDVARFG